MKKLIYLFLLSIIFVACSSNKFDENKFVFANLQENGNSIVIESDTLSSYKYYLLADEMVLDSGTVSGMKKLIFPQILGGFGGDKKELALLCAKNDYRYNMKLKVGDVVDTTFKIKQTISERKEENISFTGFGAPLVRKSKAINPDKELKIWLYRRQEHIENAVFDKFVDIYKALTRSGYNDYVPKGKIPVVRDISGLSYKIYSDIQADYYTVVACEYQKFIDYYIEQLVANDFNGASTSLSAPLKCHYKKDASGYRTVFLVCINKDWSYKLYPLATFAMDNSAPICLRPKSSFNDIIKDYSYYDYPHEPSSLEYKDKIRVLFPEDSPIIYGGACARVSDWNGNGLECNVTFYVDFAGDCKSVTIQRRGTLCYYQEYFGYHFKPEDKVIYSKDHSTPYTFTYKMHFEAGNNIIPLILEDFNGNKTKGEITIKAEFVRSDAPSINIENNNSIYNN